MKARCHMGTRTRTLAPDPCARRTAVTPRFVVRVVPCGYAGPVFCPPPPRNGSADLRLRYSSLVGRYVCCLDVPWAPVGDVNLLLHVWSAAERAGPWVLAVLCSSGLGLRGMSVRALALCLLRLYLSLK